MKTQQFEVTRDRITTVASRLQVAQLLGIARQSSAKITRLQSGGYRIVLTLPRRAGIVYSIRPALPPLTAADREARAASIPGYKGA